jgi:hypothetical protein
MIKLQTLLNRMDRFQTVYTVDEPFKVYGEVRETLLVDEFNRILDELDAEYERQQNKTYYGA